MRTVCPHRPGAMVPLQHTLLLQRHSRGALPQGRPVGLIQRGNVETGCQRGYDPGHTEGSTIFLKGVRCVSPPHTTTTLFEPDTRSPMVWCGTRLLGGINTWLLLTPNCIHTYGCMRHRRAGWPPGIYRLGVDSRRNGLAMLIVWRWSQNGPLRCRSDPSFVLGHTCSSSEDRSNVFPARPEHRSQFVWCVYPKGHLFYGPCSSPPWSVGAVHRTPWPGTALQP